MRNHNAGQALNQWRNETACPAGKRIEAKGLAESFAIPADDQ
ncbi:hypothetical protein [Iodobacter fluviatilis]|nr:hypothetical protein [Iodobacter fluviatilis]